MNDTNARKPKIGIWLLGIFLLWPGIVLGVGSLGQAAGSQFATFVAYLGSPILAAILVGIAVRHYPATRTFLKILVAIILVVTLLGGGFWHCATVARSGSLLGNIVDFFSGYSHAEPPMSIPDLVGLTLRCVALPLGDYQYEMMPFYTLPVLGSYQIFYTAMPAPYYLLLMFITPPFLAMPVFWLWVILSVLYVVLPPRAWKWIKTRAKLLWVSIRHLACSFHHSERRRSI